MVSWGTHRFICGVLGNAPLHLWYLGGTHHFVISWGNTPLYLWCIGGTHHFICDVLGECTTSFLISWGNAPLHLWYLGGMHHFICDILGEHTTLFVISWGNNFMCDILGNAPLHLWYLGGTHHFICDILGEHTTSFVISWGNTPLHLWYLGGNTLLHSLSAQRGGSAVFQHISKFLPEYTVSHPRRHYIRSMQCGKYNFFVHLCCYNCFPSASSNQPEVP